VQELGDDFPGIDSSPSVCGDPALLRFFVGPDLTVDFRDMGFWTKKFSNLQVLLDEVS